MNNINIGENLLILTDSYKVTHYKQYPEDTENVYSYLESRGGTFDKTVFFGLQYFLKKYLEGQVVTKEKIEQARKMLKLHFSFDYFNLEDWNYILEEYNGYLPISIKAVPEGSLIDTKNVLMTIENTDPRCFWLTNYLETLLVQVWYPITTATISYNMKRLILKYLHETGSPALIDFKLHDFGFRGVSSVESAAIGGAGHLLNFMGTDTMIAYMLAYDFYDCEMAGFSIPASEHSTITSWGQVKEVDAFHNMLKQFADSSLIACVSDSYDIYNACSKLWGGKLKEHILNMKGTLVIRPDSGNGVEVISKILDILAEKFGYVLNDKGYKVLNDKVRIIQGDGCNLQSCENILEKMKKQGFSADNITFGMGGALLQKCNRDTQSIALKCSAIKIKGKWHEVYKKPITDKKKYSKAGKLDLIQTSYGYQTYSYLTDNNPNQENLLIEVFRNGKLLKNYSFKDCRKLLNNNLN